MDISLGKNPTNKHKNLNCISKCIREGDKQNKQ